MEDKAFEIVIDKIENTQTVQLDGRAVFVKANMEFSVNVGESRWGLNDVSPELMLEWLVRNLDTILYDPVTLPYDVLKEYTDDTYVQRFFHDHDLSAFDGEDRFRSFVLWSSSNDTSWVVVNNDSYMLTHKELSSELINFGHNIAASLEHESGMNVSVTLEDWRDLMESCEHRSSRMN